MPIKNINVKLREIGRIRLGQRVGGKGAPQRLDTFRFTAPSSSLIATVANAYGGEPTGWESPRGMEWQVISESSEIPVVLPPYSYFDQWYELWSAGGCQRRCDGEWESIGKQPCVCNPEERQCKETTRLWVMLPEVEALGAWRLETHSFYAAQELSGVAAFLAMASAKNSHIPARLRIEKRSVKRDGQTQNFSLPVIDVDVSMTALLDYSQAAKLSGQQAENGKAALAEPEPQPESVIEDTPTVNRTQRARAWIGRLTDSSDPRVATMGAREMRQIVDDLGLDAGDVQALLGVALTDGLDGLADTIESMDGNPTYLYIARRMVQTVVDSETVAV